MLDKEGILWIATNGDGFCALDPETGKFTYFRHDPENPSGLSDNEVSNCYG